MKVSKFWRSLRARWREVCCEFPEKYHPLLSTINYLHAQKSTIRTCTFLFVIIRFVPYILIFHLSESLPIMWTNCKNVNVREMYPDMFLRTCQFVKLEWIVCFGLLPFIILFSAVSGKQWRLYLSYLILIYPGKPCPCYIGHSTMERSRVLTFSHEGMPLWYCYIGQSYTHFRPRMGNIFLFGR